MAKSMIAALIAVGLYDQLHGTVVRANHTSRDRSPKGSIRVDQNFEFIDHGGASAS